METLHILLIWHIDCARHQILTLCEMQSCVQYECWEQHDSILAALVSTQCCLSPTSMCYCMLICVLFENKALPVPGEHVPSSKIVSESTTTCCAVLWLGRFRSSFGLRFQTRNNITSLTQPTALFKHRAKVCMCEYSLNWLTANINPVIYCV